MTVTATAEQYAEFCDVVERAWQRWDVDSHRDDECLHTSDYVRAGANRTMEILDLDVDPA
jgi:hypothetical protein